MCHWLANMGSSIITIRLHCSGTFSNGRCHENKPIVPRNIDRSQERPPRFLDGGRTAQAGLRKFSGRTLPVTVRLLLEMRHPPGIHDQPLSRRTTSRRRGLRIVAPLFKSGRGQLFWVAEHEAQNPVDFGKAVHCGIPEVCGTKSPPRSGLRPLVYENAGIDAADWHRFGIWRLGAAGRPAVDRILRRWGCGAAAAGVAWQGVKSLKNSSSNINNIGGLFSTGL